MRARPAGPRAWRQDAVANREGEDASSTVPAPVLPTDGAANRPEADGHEHPPEGFGRAAAAGALWLTVQKWLVRLSGLVTIAVLTRLVSPGEFGIVAVASAVLPFIYLLSDLGLSTYLVQASDPDQRVLSTGYWLSLSAAGVLGGTMFAGAPLLSDMLGAPEATTIMRVLLISVPLVVLASVPTALLRRRMRFRLLAWQGAAGAIAAQAAAIVVALAHGGVWALVAQALTSVVVTSTSAWVAARWRPSAVFSRADFLTMARFGYKVVAVELIAVLRNWAETAIVVVVLGTSALGYLSIAQRLVQVAQDLGGSAVAPVSLVVLAKVRDTPERLRQAYLRALRIVYGAVAPVLVFVAVAAPVVIPLLFGAKWSESMPVARGLAVAGILTLGALLDNGLFYALGRAGRWLAYSSVTDAVTVGATALAASHGLTAIAWAFVGVALLATVVRWTLVSREIGTSERELARLFFTAMLTAAGSAAAGLAVMAAVPGPPLVGTLVTGTAIVAVHVVLLRVIVPATLRDAVEHAPVPARWRGLLLKASRLPA